MDDSQLLRYNRQIMLPHIGVEGQQKLCAARVLIIGLGGLGSPAAMYLTAAGVGHLVLVDDDNVELTNLQRQIVHRNHNIGHSKVESARENLLQINPDTHISCINHRLKSEQLKDEVSRADVIIDASDNFETRFDINRVCVDHKKPLVSGAAIQLEGQISVFDSRETDCPCYSCLYPEQGEDAETCSENGVLAPVVGIIGSMQALEAIKLICDIGAPLRGRLLLLDALNMQWRSMNFKKDPACKICGQT